MSIHLALLLLLLNLASTWYMTGLIWFVQIVHYAQFDGVGPDSFVAYHQRHTRMTTWVVGPPMLIEALTAVGLLVWGETLVPTPIAWIGLALLAIVWFSTAFLQVPQHDVLAKGFDAPACRLLCLTNWIRTIAWSARAALMLLALWNAVTQHSRF